MTDTLVIAKKDRAVIRTSVNTFIDKIETLIKDDNVDLNDLEENLEQLIEASNNLTAIDSDVKKLTKENQLDAEIQGAEEFRQKIILWRFRANKKIKEINKKSETSLESVKPELNNGKKETPNIKLPKLQIIRYSGIVSEFLTFWSSFENAIHKNSNLDPVDKFNYLRSYLSGTALKSIEGFAVTAENYEKAIDIITQRFGQKELLINAHMSNLLNLTSLKSSNDVKGLRRIYDDIQINIRSLESLDVSLSTYSALLSPILLKILSKDLLIEFNKDFVNKSYNAQDIIDFIYKHLLSREKFCEIENERSFSLHNPRPDRHTDAKPNFRLYGSSNISFPARRDEVNYQQNKNAPFEINNYSKQMPFRAYQSNPSDFSNKKKCYSCGIYGHKSYECRFKHKNDKTYESNKSVNNVSLQKINSKIEKTISINKMSVNSIIDTGSEITLINKNCYDYIGSPILKYTDIRIKGVGDNNVKLLGYFIADINIDDNLLNAKIYVLENLQYSAIVGMDILSNLKFNFSKGQIEFNNVNIIEISKKIEPVVIKEIVSSFVVCNSDKVDSTAIPHNDHLCVNIPHKIEPFVSENEVTIKNDFVSSETNFLSALPVGICPYDTEIEIGHDIPNNFKNRVQDLVLNYEPNKSLATNVELNILVKTNEPVYHQPRRLPFSEKKIVEAQVTEWLKNGIIEPSSSEYCSPVVIVRKKDGSPRVCIDFRKLNKIVVKDRFPLPLIEDILDRLQSARIFSTIDLKNGFFHVDVSKDSRKYTSFVTHEGQYQFLKVPFGLCNSPAVFQRYINTVFRPLINSGIVLPYMDDVIILASTLEEAVERLEQVFNLASEYGLEINFKKSQFLKKRIEFLGHVIEEGKISPSTLKTQAVLKYPEPTNLKQVQSFLGLTGYFRKFIPKYSIIAKPLSDLLKKDRKFKFDVEEKNAFMHLKSLLAEKPVLAIYNPHYETELHTDASLEGYGAILMQKSPNDGNFHPTYYMSRKTTDAEKKYSSYELEVLAIIEALKKFRVYLLGIRFKIITDCAAFEKTMEKKDLCTRVARWVLLLQEFNYGIEHRLGTKMPHVDALSRSPIDVFCVELENIAPRIKIAQEKDEKIKTIKELLKISNYEDYCERNGILYKFVQGKELIVLPESMQTEIIREAHEKGHTGVKYTEKHLEEYYFIPKLKQKIENVIANCVHCILTNRKRGKKEGFLHPLYKEDRPLHTYHIDHLGPLESTHKNYHHVFTIVDAFTKFVWIYPTKTTTAAEVIAKLEIQKTVFGSPSMIISDKGPAFTSDEFAEYCAKEEINHQPITTGLPRANGQVERINQIIISILSKLSLEKPAEWYKHTSELQRIMNSTYQRSIDTTPFELLFGTKMKIKGSDRLKEMLEAEFQSNFEGQREELRKQAKKQIFKVQEENKKTYNLRRKEPLKHKVGDLVAIKRTQFGPQLKLKSKFFGPYKITKVKGGNTYDVIKEGYHEGPYCTTTCAEFLKPWMPAELV